MRFDMMMGQHGSYVTAIHREPGERPCSVCGSEDVRTHWNVNGGAAGGTTGTDMQPLCGACATKRGITYLKTLPELMNDWMALRGAVEHILAGLMCEGDRIARVAGHPDPDGDMATQVKAAMRELEIHWPALRKPR